MRNNYKKTVALITALILLLSAFPVYAAETRFPDAVGHWAEEYIDALADKGIISGMDDGLFYPDSPVTTSEFVTMILRSAIGDVAPLDEYWASGYLDVALERGIVDEYDIRSRDKAIIRRSAATIGHNALVSIFDEADEEDVSAATSLGDLRDCEACIPHISQFYVKGIMIGRPDSKFYGAQGLTRAEAAVVIMKMLDKSLRTPQTDTPKASAPVDSLAGHEDDAARFVELFPVSEDHPFVFASFEEVVNHLEKETGIVAFAFPACPRCKNAFPVLEKAFKEMGLDKLPGLKGKILYYDIFDDREANNERYQTLVKLTKEFIPLDGEDNPRIYSPDIYFVSEGKIVGNHLDTVPSLTNPRDALNEEQAAELLEIYKELFEAMDCGC